jgi:transposase
MSHKKNQGIGRGRRRQLPQQLECVNLDAAGIDVGAEEHYVAVPSDRDEYPVQTFSAFTPDLERLAQWLQDCGIKTIAMEATGVYWIPLFELLESKGFAVCLVNPKHLKTVPGRKTDVLDCQWLQKLHTFGLLSPSFRPPEEICKLRSYMRQRAMLVECSSTHIQHMQKALTEMNVKLQHVVSDIMGVTGLRIIDAILSGERDPDVLASLRHERCKRDAATIARALQGNWREEHLFSLQQARELHQFYEQKIQECDEQIQAQLELLPQQTAAGSAPKHSQRWRRKNQLHFDARHQLIQTTGVDLTEVDGLETHTVLKLLSETGTDMTPWKTEKHFTSWLGLSPGNKKSGGKQLSGRRAPRNHRAATIFRLAARTLHHADCALGAFLRRLKQRLGPAKAITATARKLAVIYYRMLRDQKPYQDLGKDYYEAAYRKRLLNNLQRRAESLGYALIPNDLQT